MLAYQLVSYKCQTNRQTSVFVQVGQIKVMHILVVNLVGFGFGRIKSLSSIINQFNSNLAAREPDSK